MNWGKYLSGWKTYVGGALLVVSLVFRLQGEKDVADAIMTLGGFFGVIGIRHKMGRMALKGKVDELAKEDPLKDDTAFNH